MSLCFAYIAGFGVYTLQWEMKGAQGASSPETRIFWEAWHRAEEHFFGSVPPARDRTYAAIRASLALLDAHTVFVEPVSRQLEQDRLRGAYGGIGVSLRCNEREQITLSPYPGSPAEAAGLSAGDVLLAVDAAPVRGRSESDVRAKLRGELGTRVRLRVRTASGSLLEVVVERQRIKVPSVMWRMETPDVGYLQVSRFTQRTDEELAAALEELDSRGASGLVLDLRGNRGGLVESAVAVAGRFLEPGAVVLRKTGRTEDRILHARDEVHVKAPLVVLVDRETASAAEIVAGALQDHDRALLMGEPTFGKGSVQEIYDLSDGSSLHVTAAIWLTPDGHPIHHRGLVPDRRLSGGDDAGDTCLRQAVDYLESE